MASMSVIAWGRSRSYPQSAADERRVIRPDCELVADAGDDDVGRRIVAAAMLRRPYC